MALPESDCKILGIHSVPAAAALTSSGGSVRQRVGVKAISNSRASRPVLSSGPVETIWNFSDV